MTRYLKDLDRALRDVPDDARREIVDEAKAQLARTAADHGEEMTETELRSILERAGHPEVVAAQACERLGIQRRRGGAMEGIAIFALLVGGIIVPVIGWMVGAVLLWASSAWSTRDKILATLVLPGGLAVPLFIAAVSVSVSSCVETAGGTECANRIGVFGWILLVALLLAPIAVAIYLGRKAFRR